MEIKTNNIDICECECHTKGLSVMHCVPCCEFTYGKYIDNEGEIDYVEYGKLLRQKRNDGRLD